MFRFLKTAIASSKSPVRTLGVRAWLMLFALAIVALMAVDRVRLIQANRSEQMAFVRADVVDVVRRVADAQREVFEASRGTLKTVARFYSTAPQARDDCRAFLNTFVADMPWIVSLSAVGADGRIACATEPSADGTDLSNRPFVEKAKQSWDFTIGNDIAAGDGDGPAIMAAYPARARDIKGSTEAVIVARIAFDWFNRVMGMAQRRESLAAVLVDGEGYVIAGVPDRHTLAGPTISDHPLLRGVLTRQEGTLAGVGVDGIRRVMAFTRLTEIDASVIVGLDEREFVSRLDREVIQAYVQFVMAAVLIMLAAWIGGKRLIVEPTRVLAGMASRIGRGELGARSKQRMIWAAEFAPLSAALTEMASRLAEREQGLRSANRHLSTLAAIDSLTKLPNRRSFDAGLDDEWQRAYEQGWPISLMMIDVDHFKLYNDHYGHVEGDRCLELIGEALSAIVPTKADFAARYGGEEFALLLPATALRAALNAAERLRVAVEQLKIVHEKAHCGHITVSIGVASLMPGDKNTPQDLIEAADAGLYEAKRKGRNAVGIRDESPPLVPGMVPSIAPSVGAAAPADMPPEKVAASK